MKVGRASSRVARGSRQAPPWMKLFGEKGRRESERWRWVFSGGW